jgi:hypothetical protein
MLKTLAIWLGIAMAANGAAAGGYHAWLSADPRTLLVIVDTSYEMRGRREAVSARLDQLSNTPYTTYALYTEKARVHSWSDHLNGDKLRPFGPRSFERLASGSLGAELTEADSVVLVTNAPASALKGLPVSWDIESIQ